MKFPFKISEDWLWFPFESSVKSLWATLRGEKKTVLLQKDGKVVAIIVDYASLIESHSFCTSPFPVGVLLKNAVRALALVEGVARRGTPRSWIPLRSALGETIAWLAPDSAPLSAAGDQGRQVS
jgi:hypothetical protein